MRLISAIRRARIPWFGAVTAIEAEGEARLRRVGFIADGQRHTLATELMLIHEGVTPALQVTEVAGCRTEWSAAQQCWQARVDAWGETSQPGIFCVGDGAAIGGARVAALSGRLAGLQVAFQSGMLEQSHRDRSARLLFGARARHLAIRPWLDAYYRPADSVATLADTVLVCRCEEVTAGQLRNLLALDCAGPNQAKAFTRCGMGPCQGRFCAATLEQVCAHNGPGADEPVRLRSRPPLKPVTLGQLAQSMEDENERENV